MNQPLWRSWVGLALAAGLAFSLPAAGAGHSLFVQRLAAGHGMDGILGAVVRRALHDRQIMNAAWISLVVGVVSASLATVIGTAAGYALARFGRFKARWLFSVTIVAPLVVPEVITGLSLLLLFVAAQALLPFLPGRGVTTIVIAHASFTHGGGGADRAGAACGAGA